jgi:hypothetical protein
MKELIDKISSYKLFNYLLPGVIFSILANNFTKYSIIQKDIIIGAFVYYFIGVGISRFGSLIIEPVLKKASFLKSYEYEDFATSSKKDDKLEILLEATNIYRTLLATFILLLFFKLFEIIANRLPILDKFAFVGLIFFLFIIYLFAYKKQNAYVAKHINIVKKSVKTKRAKGAKKSKRKKNT